jgi:chemotaxis protein MotB
LLGEDPETTNRGQRILRGLCGLKARTQALEIVANNLANLNSTGYSSSQVDQRKVGKLATAIQAGFQELAVFPASSSAISTNTQEPIPFNTVQAIENAERTAALGRIVPSRKRHSGPSENGDLSSLRQELEDALAPEIQRNEVAVSAGPDGLVVSLREIGFFDSGSPAKIRSTSLSAFSRIAWLLAERPYRVRIEGHTDNKPIHNAQFSDNWEFDCSRLRVGAIADSEVWLYSRTPIGGRVRSISPGCG